MLITERFNFDINSEFEIDDNKFNQILVYYLDTYNELIKSDEQNEIFNNNNFKADTRILFTVIKNIFTLSDDDSEVDDPIKYDIFMDNISDVINIISKVNISTEDYNKLIFSINSVVDFLSELNENMKELNNQIDNFCNKLDSSTKKLHFTIYITKVGSETNKKMKYCMELYNTIEECLKDGNLETIVYNIKKITKNTQWFINTIDLFKKKVESHGFLFRHNKPDDIYNAETINKYTDMNKNLDKSKKLHELDQYNIDNQVYYLYECLQMHYRIIKRFGIEKPEILY